MSESRLPASGPQLTAVAETTEREIVGESGGLLQRTLGEPEVPVRGSLIVAIVEDTWLLQSCAEAKWEQKIPTPPESCLFPSDGAQPKADRQESQSA